MTAPGPMSLLGTPLEIAGVERWTAQVNELAGAGRVVAVDFSNTHTVTLRAVDQRFAGWCRSFDYFVPDGMPLVWCLNRKGAGLSDRIYGPAFFKEFLQQARAGSRHYFVGGSPECGERLRRVIAGWNPEVVWAGSFAGRCEEDGCMADGRAEIGRINEAAPDFIWVGLGTPKQQAWVARYKGELRRGVILTVGFAFDVQAGLKADAPDWMQRAGLTWLFRLASEPGRLAWRYASFNTLFLALLVLETIGWKRKQARNCGEQPGGGDAVRTRSLFK